LFCFWGESGSVRLACGKATAPIVREKERQPSATINARRKRKGGRKGAGKKREVFIEKQEDLCVLHLRSREREEKERRKKKGIGKVHRECLGERTENPFTFRLYCLKRKKRGGRGKEERTSTDSTAERGLADCVQPTRREREKGEEILQDCVRARLSRDSSLTEEGKIGGDRRFVNFVRKKTRDRGHANS